MKEIFGVNFHVMVRGDWCYDLCTRPVLVRAAFLLSNNQRECDDNRFPSRNTIPWRLLHRSNVWNTQNRIREIGQSEKKNIYIWNFNHLYAIFRLFKLTLVSKMTLIRLIFPYFEKISWILSSVVLAASPNTPRHFDFGGGGARARRSSLRFCRSSLLDALESRRRFRRLLKWKEKKMNSIKFN